MLTVFQVIMMGYWEKFLISNNPTLDKPYWLRYCSCTKLIIASLILTLFHSVICLIIVPMLLNGNNLVFSG